MKLVKVFLALILSIGIAFISVPNLYADETSEVILKILIKKGLITEEEVASMKAEIEKERIAKGESSKDLETRVAKLEKSKKLSSWAERIKLKGDIRFRHEVIWDNDSTTRNRERVRARLGAYAKINDQVDAGMRIVSGNDNPTSTNQTLTDYFESKPLMLDWAYIDFHPWEWMNTKAGMFKNPFMHTELLWDSDVSFGGAVMQLYYDLPYENLPPTTVFANIGEFPLDDISTSVQDPWLFAYQGGYRTKINENVKWDGAVAYYQFVNINDMVIEHSSGGNTRDFSNTNLRKEFHLIDLTSKVTIKDPFKRLGMDTVDIPALIFKGDVVFNVHRADQNMGWLAGATIGHPKVKDKGQWSLNYNYRHLEADAQLDVFPDADFHGGTNAKGHNIIFKYGLLKNTILAAEYYHTRNIKVMDRDDHDDRLQLDAIVKF